MVLFRRLAIKKNLDEQRYNPHTHTKYTLLHTQYTHITFRLGCLE